MRFLQRILYICFLLFSLLGISIHGYSQTQTCTNATTVAVNACTSISKNITAASNPIEAPSTANTSCLSSSANARDIWVRFTAANTTATITANTAAAKNLAVICYSYTCVASLITNTVELGCVDANTATAAQTETLTLTGLTTGGDYLIRIIATTSAGASNTTINLTILSPQFNDEPNAAVVITAPSSSCAYISGNLKGATQTTCGGIATPTCGTYGASSVDTWYSVTVPASGNLFLQTANGSATSLGMAAYSGAPCSSMSLLGCSEGNPEGSVSGAPSLYLPGQTPGSTIYIRVWNKNGQPPCTFSICATTLGPCGNAANNDFCSNPASMTPSAGTFSSSTTSSGTYSYTPDSPGDLASAALCSNSFDHNSWYSFVATANTQTFAINTSATNCAGGLSAQVFSVATNNYNCCKSFTAVAGSCLNASTGAATLTASSLSVGATYYIMMESFGGAAESCTYTVSGWSATGILPIDLISFYGTNKGNVNYIEWITSFSEKNVDAYVLESSADGAVFEKISEIKAISKNGNSSEQFYHTYDPSPFKEVTYYRLRQVKLGGISNLSHVIAVLGPDFYETIHNLYPNPTTNDLNFDFYSKIKSNLKIELIGYGGSVVYAKLHTLEEGNNTVFVPMSELDNGVYILKVVSEKTGKTTHHKIIKN